MTKPRTEKTAEKTARKRPTREQFDERLSIPLGPKKAKASVKVEPVPEVDAASRQRIRDRAGD